MAKKASCDWKSGWGHEWVVTKQFDGGRVQMGPVRAGWDLSPEWRCGDEAVEAGAYLPCQNLPCPALPCSCPAPALPLPWPTVHYPLHYTPQASPVLSLHCASPLSKCNLISSPATHICARCCTALQNLFLAHTLDGHRKGRVVQFTTAGCFVFSCLGQDGGFEVIQWSPDSFTLVHRFQPPAGAQELCAHCIAASSRLTHDLRLYCGASNGAIYAFEHHKHTPVQALKGHKSAVLALAIVGQMLWSGGEDSAVKVPSQSPHQPSATLRKPLQPPDNSSQSPTPSKRLSPVLLVSLGTG